MIELEGCLNFRDLGGHQTSDGRTVRSGCLFRSAELCLLTDADRVVFSELGIKVVVDLRSAQEQDVRPQSFPNEITVVSLRRVAAGSTETLEEQIEAGRIPVKDDQWVIDSYIGMLTRLAPDFRALVERSADAVRAPVLFHCAAGKDRTGLAAAVLLGLLGVPDHVIQAEYELTTLHYAPRRLEEIRPLLEQHSVSASDISHLIEARPVGMKAVLDHINSRWGGFAGYAQAVLGVDAALVGRLQAELLA